MRLFARALSSSRDSPVSVGENETLDGRTDGWKRRIDGRTGDTSTRTRSARFHSPRDKVEQLYPSDRDVAHELVRAAPDS